MPRLKDASGQRLFSCSFLLSADIYQQFQLLSGKTAIGMRELLKLAAESYVKQQLGQLERQAQKQ
jgi:hypothetical protein